MKDDLTALLPLTPAILHILLALAGEDRHGYGVMQEVARQSEGTCKLGPGTLYDNLQRLVDAGLIQEASGRSADENSRRRYYRLTAFGRRVLSAELVRLGRLLRETKAHVRATSLVRVS